MTFLFILNHAFALLYGMILSLSFAEVNYKKYIRKCILMYSLFGLMQLLLFFIFPKDVIFRAYPFFVHIPLYLILRFYFNKNSYVSAISVLSAYLFCTPRKWLGTLVAAFFNNSEYAFNLTQILVSIPLLLIITKYFSPYIIRLKYESSKIIKIFLMVPLVYYILSYGLTVYSDIFYDEGKMAAELLDSAVVIIYFISSAISLKMLYQKNKVETEQELLKTQVNQSMIQIDSLRKYQMQASIYRHDLRHHLSFISMCISENKLEEAQAYINATCEDIENTRLNDYCEDETINLIISAYITKAKKRNISCDIKVTTNDFSRFKISDLCSLLSNALENAIHANEKIGEICNRWIKLYIYEKSNRLCISLTNAMKEPIIWCNELPINVSGEEGHGIGVKSIVYIVEKYQGVYKFTAQDNIFTFQVTM